MEAEASRQAQWLRLLRQSIIAIREAATAAMDVVNGQIGVRIRAAVIDQREDVADKPPVAAWLHGADDELRRLPIRGDGHELGRVAEHAQSAILAGEHARNCLRIARAAYRQCRRQICLCLNCGAHPALVKPRN